MSYLEDEILGFTVTCFNRPMLSSHTTANISTGDEGGRPTNESQGVVLTESGEASQEAGEDNNNANVQ